MKKSLLTISLLATSLFGVAQESSAVNENYPDPLVGSDYVLAEAYNVVGSEINLLSEQLAGKTIRRQIIRDNKLYVLALDAENEPYIYLADLAAGTVTELDKVAVVAANNGRLKISDITFTADGVLVATSLSKNQYNADQIDAGEVRGSVNVYKWSKNETTSIPETCELWFSSEISCKMNRCLVGKTIAYSGTSEEGSLTASGHHATATSSIGLRFAKFDIVGGQFSAESWIGCWETIPNETYFYTDVLGENNDFELMMSPLNKDNFVIDGNRVSPFEWTYETGEGTVVARNELIDVRVNGANHFKYNGKTVTTAPAINEDGKITGLVAYDITNGFDNAVAIDFTGAEISASDYTYASAHGEVNATTAAIDLFLVVDGKVNKFSAAGITVGIEEISTSLDSPVEYYNLQGMKVTYPENGIFIKKQGAKATKIVL